MLTIFTIPKAFTDESALSQRNAIRSWRQLKDVQIILCGDDDGVAEAAAELGCDHFPTLRRTERGTPRLDDAFAAAEQLARHELICYVNADIVLLPGFEEAIGKLTQPRFLIAGRRMNVWLSTEIQFEGDAWDVDLWRWAAEEGKYAPPDGSDYFIYRRGTLKTIPPFAVGRPYWDNWMMFMARRKGWPLIDGTRVVRAIHQNHEYTHVPDAAGGRWEGPEGETNLRIGGGYRIVFSLADATHSLGPTGLQSLRGWSQYLRRTRRWLENLPGAEWARAVFRLRRALFRNGGANG